MDGCAGLCGDYRSAVIYLFVSHHWRGGYFDGANFGQWRSADCIASLYRPTPGDVVVIVQPESDTPAIIKRIIAVEGQTVDINFSFGTVTVDGQVLEEDYINEPTYMKRDVDFPVTVPQGCVFVMGDNRNRSLDSRDSSIGMVDQRYILGKAVFRLFPFQKIGLIE